MSATGGLGFMDLSAGVQNYWYGDLLFEGSLHLYWAKGMGGQNLMHLCPQLMASYQVTSQHRVFVSYESMFIPMTLASNIIANRYLSAASIVKHEYIAGAGELGIESNWTEAVRSRISVNVKSISDLPMFSDSFRQGVWMLVYGGQARIVIFYAEMVAKLNSNDYFASNILLRSTNDSFLGGKIPYTPAIEAWCSAIHRFGTTTSVSANIRFAGERTTDLARTAMLSKYAVVDVSGEYTPFDFLRFTVGIKNLTDSKFETWRGYREFPFTIQVNAQIKW
jgi:outer membrane cobalamin receptor